ncbi:MAG: rhomboid family intramembrane serine protease [Myxococcota bacterium]
MASDGKSLGRTISRPAALSLGVAVGVVLILVARWLMLGGGSPSITALVAAGAKVDELVLDGEWWRLASAGLLHASATHLIVNALLLGFALVAWLRLGRARHDEGIGRAAAALAMTILTSFIGFGVSTLARSGASAGASAAAHGMLAAVVVSVWIRRADLPPSLARVGPMAVTAAFIAVLLASSAAQGVDHAAHLGGVAAGVALTPLAESRARPGLIGLAAALAVTSLIAAFT